jgi:RND family efflux transporter MFP subunit
MKRFALLLALACAGPAAADISVISCLLEPSRRITVSSAVEGPLVKVSVERGATVRAGDVMARIDSAVEEAQLDAARYRAESVAAIRSREAQLAEARRQVAQARELVDRGVGTANTLAELEAEAAIAESLLGEAVDAREAARLEVASAEAALERRRVRAPMDGVVLERSLDAGEFASPDLPLVTLVAVDLLHAELLLPDAAYGQVGLDSAVTITQQGDGLSRAGRVLAVDPVIDAASLTFGVRVAVENGDGAFTAGRRCSARFGAVE